MSVRDPFSTSSQSQRPGGARTRAAPHLSLTCPCLPSCFSCFYLSCPTWPWQEDQRMRGGESDHGGGRAAGRDMKGRLLLDSSCELSNALGRGDGEVSVPLTPSSSFPRFGDHFSRLHFCPPVIRQSSLTRIPTRGADMSDLRPLLVCTDSAVMSAAAHVVGKMVQVAGPNLGESWFQKEIGQALNQLEGACTRSSAL